MRTRAGFVIPAGALFAGRTHVTAFLTMTALLLASLAARYAIVRLPRDATRSGLAGGSGIVT
jgi:hypothetical protein